MRFTPKSDEELRAEMGILEPGKGQFQILSAKDKVSKTGNEMIELVLKVWDSKGQEGQVYDYITGNATWKLKGLLVAIDKEHLYKSGSIAESDLVNGMGGCNIAIEKSEAYGDKAKIKSYFPNSKGAPLIDNKSAPSNEPPAFDEDVPF